SRTWGDSCCRSATADWWISDRRSSPRWRRRRLWSTLAEGKLRGCGWKRQCRGPLLTDMPARLALRGLTKRFPGVLANDNVSFEVKPGEIHALLGENGAGKSTLVKMIYGIMQPDAGEIYWNGDRVVVT